MSSIFYAYLKLIVIMIKNTLLFSLLLFSRFSLAQLSPTPTANINPKIQIPESETLGIFTKIPVSLYTGVPNIAVPIHDLKYKDLHVPISLNYHNAIGNKVDVFPGEVGAGWQLAAGGSITLLERSLEYEEYTSGRLGELRALDIDYIRSENWYTQEKLDSLLTYNHQLYANNNKPYFYNYNFLGHNGYIMIDHDGVPRIVSSEGDYFKVEMEKSVTHSFDLPFPPQTTWAGFFLKNILFSQTAYRFTLTDKSGVKYTFGGQNDAVALRRTGIEWAGSVPYDRDNEGVNPFKWELTSIESPDGYRIDFKYIRGDFYMEYDWNQEFKIAYTPGAPDGNYRNAHLFPFPKGYDSRITATLVNPVYLSSIVTPLDSIVFHTSLADGQLPPHSENNLFDLSDSYHQVHFSFFSDIGKAIFEDRWPQKYDGIKIYTKDQPTERSSVSFQYTNNVNERLKLQAVRFKSKSSALPHNIYSFTYNPNKLPPYLSGKIDHMGFYNGKVDTDSTVSFLDRIANNTGSMKYHLTREPDVTLTKNEILTKITYPTGGSCTFEFEQHDYSKIAKKWPFVVEDQTNTAITSGLRIKRINFYTKDNELSHFKEYSYIDTSGQSSGVLSYLPYYFEEVAGTITQPKSLFDFDSDKIGQQIKLWRFNTKALNPLTAFDGSHITYSRVIEREGTNGSNIYVYTNYDNGYHDLPPLNYISDHSGIKNFLADFPGMSRRIERGQLLEHIVLNEKNDTLRSIKNEYFDYEDYLTYQNANPTSEDKFVRLVKKAANSVYHNYGVISYTIASYKLLCYYPYLKKTSIKSYFDGGVLEQHSDFLYDQYNNLVRTNTFNSKAHNVTDTLSYAYNFNGVPSYDTLVNRHQVSDVVAQKYFVNNALRVDRLNEHSFLSGIPRLSKIMDRYSPVDSFKENTKINHYDSFGNPVEVEQADGSKTCYLWGYQGEYPVLVLKNIDYSTIQNLISYSALQPLDLTKETLEFLLLPLDTFHPGIHYQYYTYVPSVGIASHTNEMGISTFYVYDEFNRLKVIKDHDGNILKTYCYNHAGQLVDCFTDVPLDLIKFTAGYGGTTLNQALSYSTDPGPFDPLMPVEDIYSASGSFFSNLLTPPNTGFFADVYGSSFLSDGFYTDFSKINSTTYLWIQIKNGQIFWSNSLLIPN